VAVTDCATDQEAKGARETRLAVPPPSWYNTNMAGGCLKRQEALDLLHRCLEEGEIVPTRHFREELANESITFEDVWIVLRSGSIYDEPEQDIKTGDWKYRVEGYEPDGKWVAIVLTFKNAERVFLVTIFSIEARRRL